MNNIKNSLVGDHQQAEGVMMYDIERNDDGKVVAKMLGFVPYEDEMIDVMPYVGNGKVQVMRDGTVDVTVKKRPASQSVCIKRTDHGRVSLTADGAVQMTLKFFVSKESDIYGGMRRESIALLRAVREINDLI